MCGKMQAEIARAIGQGRSWDIAEATLLSDHCRHRGRYADDPELAAVLKQTIDEMHADGTLTNLSMKRSRDSAPLKFSIWVSSGLKSNHLITSAVEGYAKLLVIPHSSRERSRR